MLEKGLTECVRLCRQMGSKDYGTGNEPYHGHNEYHNSSLCHYAKKNYFYCFYVDLKYYKLVHTNGMHIVGRRAVSPYHWTIFIEMNKDRSRRTFIFGSIKNKSVSSN